METAPAPRTSATLLLRLGQPGVDQQAWAAFVRSYGPLVYRWSRSWGLQEADAQDVTQSVLARLVVRLRDFRYDPARSFRAYLRTVAGYTWRDLLDERRRAGAGSGDTAHQERLGAVEAREDLARRLDEEFDRELLEEAADLVRRRVESQTWEAFRLTAVERLPGAIAAERLGMAVYAVFKARSRVQRMLRDEVAALESAGPPAAAPAREGRAHERLLPSPRGASAIAGSRAG
jgi:RNA polymerase sigma-70 factor (ECF subfamily)